MTIGSREIGLGNPVFIVAEMSCNHVGSLTVAKRTIEAAAKCGADAVKIQLDNPDGGLTINCDAEPFRIKTGPWAGRTLYDLYRETYTPWEWTPDLQRVAADCGVELFATVSCLKGVEYCEERGMPAYKVASFEITDWPLLRAIGKTGKPVILSDGCAEYEDMLRAQNAVGYQAMILHCVSGYPADPSCYDTGLCSGARDGLSDHTIGPVVAIAAVNQGALIIEKHFTIGRALGGPDAGFSCNPSEFIRYIQAIRQAESIGTKDRVIDRTFCKSIFVTRDCPKGESIDGCISVIRPGVGLHPKHWWEALASHATRDLKRGEPLREGDYA